MVELLAPRSVQMRVAGVSERSVYFRLLHAAWPKI